MSSPGNQFDAILNMTRADIAGDKGSHHGHFPYARKLRLGWDRTPAGWTYASEDDHLWEVLCAECGDKDGPADQQSPEVQRLRGPYASEHKAKHVANHHFSAN